MLLKVYVYRKIENVFRLYSFDNNTTCQKNPIFLNLKNNGCQLNGPQLLFFPKVPTKICRLWASCILPGVIGYNMVVSQPQPAILN